MISLRRRSSLFCLLVFLRDVLLVSAEGQPQLRRHSFGYTRTSSKSGPDAGRGDLPFQGKSGSSEHLDRSINELLSGTIGNVEELSRFWAGLDTGQSYDETRLPTPTPTPSPSFQPSASPSELIIKRSSDPIVETISYVAALRNGTSDPNAETTVRENLIDATQVLAYRLFEVVNETDWSSRFLQSVTQLLIFEPNDRDLRIDSKLCPAWIPATDRCWQVTQNFRFAFDDENDASADTSAVVLELNRSITDNTLQQLLDELGSLVYIVGDPPSQAPPVALAQAPGNDLPVAAIAAAAAVAGTVAVVYLVILPPFFIYYYHVLRKTVLAVKFEDKSEIKSNNWKDYSQRYMKRVKGKMQDTYGEELILHSDVEGLENGAAHDGAANEAQEDLDRVAFKLNCDYTPENHEAFLKFLEQPPYEIHRDNVSLAWKGSLNVLVRMKAAQAEEAFNEYKSESSLKFSVDDGEVFVDGMVPVVETQNSSLYEIIKGKAGGNAESDITLYKHGDMDLIIPNTMGGGYRLGVVPYYREVKQGLFCSGMKPHPSVLTVDDDTVLVRKSERDLIQELKREGFQQQHKGGGEGSGYIIFCRGGGKPRE